MQIITPTSDIRLKIDIFNKGQVIKLDDKEEIQNVTITATTLTSPYSVVYNREFDLTLFNNNEILIEDTELEKMNEGQIIFKVYIKYKDGFDLTKVYNSPYYLENGIYSEDEDKPSSDDLEKLREDIDEIKGNIPTKLSQLKNDFGYVREFYNDIFDTNEILVGDGEDEVIIGKGDDENEKHSFVKFTYDNRAILKGKGGHIEVSDDVNITLNPSKTLKVNNKEVAFKNDLENISLDGYIKNEDAEIELNINNDDNIYLTNRGNTILDISDDELHISSDNVYIDTNSYKIKKDNSYYNVVPNFSDTKGQIILNETPNENISLGISDNHDTCDQSIDFLSNGKILLTTSTNDIVIESENNDIHLNSGGKVYYNNNEIATKFQYINELDDDGGTVTINATHTTISDGDGNEITIGDVGYDKGIVLNTKEGYKATYNGNEIATKNDIDGIEFIKNSIDGEVDTIPIPNNEIWYTSTDDSVIIPYGNIQPTDKYDETKFGVNIVSNDYIDGKGVIKFDGDVQKIGDYVFEYQYTLKSIILPNSVTSIGGSAFKSCSSLTSVTIPDSVRYIGLAAFSNCESLTNIELPNSVRNIDNYAFMVCSSVTSVTIPNSVTTIRNMAFYYLPEQGTLYCDEDWYNNLSSDNKTNLGNVYNWERKPIPNKALNLIIKSQSNIVLNPTNKVYYHGNEIATKNDVYTKAEVDALLNEIKQLIK